MIGVDLIAYKGKVPQIDPSAWIAPGCRIIGDVEIGPRASIWYNCVLRGDVNRVVVGAGSNIQDGSVIHCDSGGLQSEGHPTLIGEDVLIGHLAVVHGCTLGRGSVVGMGSITMDGAVVEGGGMVAAGAMLTPYKRIGPNELWGGRPARLMRMLSASELASNAQSVEHYQQLAEAHRSALGEVRP